MEPSPAMDKKAALRLAQTPSKSGADPPNKDYGGKKNVGQYVRKKEWERSGGGGGSGGGVEYGGRRGGGGRGARTAPRYVRPREKAGGKVEASGGQVEFGSLYCSGGKKNQNITHLLDWWGPEHHRGNRGHGHGAHRTTRVRRYSSHTPKYTKEHYLQANCQFVVSDDGDYGVHSGNQDLLVDWGLVEEVRLHVATAPACPICLHPPTAAKVTRCGHIYCFPCILHYLALSDKKWRKCPICYEPVDKNELKSVVAVCHGDLSLGELVEFQLMRRERDSFMPVPAASFAPDLIASNPRLTQPTPASPFAKLLLASKEDVQSHIITRERNELEYQLGVEGDQPESCFIHEALELLRSRYASLSSPDGEGMGGLENDMGALDLSSPDEPPSSSSESFSSFDDPLSPLSPTFEPASPLSPTFGLFPPRGTEKGGEENQEIAKEGKGEKGTMGDEKEDYGVSRSMEGAAFGEEASPTVEDLDSPQFQTPGNNSNSSGGQRQSPKQTFYFYQARNGGHVYLHPINIHMLEKEYGALENCPHFISAKVVEKVTYSMDEDLRSRHRYLRHLPITSSVEVLEVALVPPLLSLDTLASFHDKIKARQRARNRKAREERKIEKRVKAEEDRMLGRSKGATNLKIESLKHFPSFCEEIPQSFDVGAEGGGLSSVGPPESEVLGSPVGSWGSEVLPTSNTVPQDTPTTMSFAKMIREGKARENKSGNGRSVWPGLGGSAPQPTQQGGKKNAWDGKPANVHNDGGDSDDEGAAPEFKNAFSDAVSRALEAAATRTSTANSNEEKEASGGGRKGKNKKKKKQLLLFSSGGLN